MNIHEHSQTFTNIHEYSQTFTNIHPTIYEHLRIVPTMTQLTCDALIQLLDDRRRLFATQPLSVREEERFQRANNLTSEDPGSMYYLQKKARLIYIAIRDRVGYDAFLLCSVVQSCSQFGKSQLGADYADNISKWWSTVDSPKELRELAKLKSGKEQDKDEIHKHRTESGTHETTILHFELIDLISFLQRFEKDQTQTSTLPFEFTSLIGFLQQFEGTCPKLHLTCPWNGEPSPSIYIAFSPSFSAKVEISLELCGEMLGYLKLRAGGKNIAMMASQIL